MKMKTNLKAIAYSKGVDAAKKKVARMSRNLPPCPYGETKAELEFWFWGGYHDYLSKTGYDRVLYKAGKKEKDDATD